MGQHNVETVQFQVPCDEGHIIGDFLRKYATRSVGTWQVIGYKIDSQSPNFGFSGETLVSYFDLLDGVLVYSGEPATMSGTGPKVCTFRWNGQCYAYDQFELRGLKKAFGESLDVCICYGRGHKSAEQNTELIRSVTGGNPQGFYAIPSSHSIVSTFRYRVTPVDDSCENLTIEADAGVVKRALDTAVKSLTGLGI